MPAPSSRTAGIYAKVERAKKHVRELEALVQGFFETNPYEIVVQDDPDTGDRAFTVKILHQPPLEWSAVVGDAVHNLRAALDLLVCELVRGEGQPIKDNTSFPIFRSKDAFDNAFKSGVPGQIKGAPKDAIRLIRRLKPYKGGNEPLFWLHRLDIADKHRVLITVGSAHENVIVDPAAILRKMFANTDVGFDLSQIPSTPIALNPADRQWPLKDGAEIYRVMAAARSTHEDQDTQFTFGIAFGEGEVVEGEPLLPTLHDLINFVEKIIVIFDRRVF